MEKEASAVVAFIPVRGGSKGIPGKNIKPIGGRPLLYWALDAAVGCNSIHRVCVSTDDPRIAEHVVAYGHAKVQAVERSPETATDTATTESAMLEFARERQFETMVLIQATSPLLQSSHLVEAFEVYRSSGVDSLLSVVRQRRFLWEFQGGRGRPVNYDPLHRPRRQSLAGYYVENGAFYITRRHNLVESGCRLSGTIGLYEMPEETYYELDEPADWEVIDALLRRRESERRLREASPLRSLKLFVCDVDGVLTDAGMYYSEAGDELKKFNTRDGKAFELLRQRGVITAILTSENTRLVERRARKLRIDHVLQGADRKAEALTELCSRVGVELAEVAYVGDDLNDLGVLPIVGFSACPADAVAAVKAAAKYVCRSRGGEGCVREIVDMLL